MMKFSLFLFYCLSISTNAFEIEAKWSSSLNKEIHVTCSREDQLCLRLCSDYHHCLIREEICRDCLGRGLEMSYVQQEVGRQINKQGAALSSIDLEDRIVKTFKKRSFITLYAKSIYNQLYRFNDIGFQRHFLSLCPGVTVDKVIVLFKRNKKGSIGNPDFVLCGDQGYLLTKVAKAIVSKTDKHQ